MNYLEGLTNMLADVSELFKMAFTTKKGLALVTICLFIYLTSLLFTSGYSTWVLIMALVSLISFLVISWLTWFSDDDS